MSVIWNFMKTAIVVFVVIFMALIYALAERGEMSKWGLFITISCVVIILIFFLRILEGTPTYLRVGKEYRAQYCFTLPDDRGYILSLIEGDVESLNHDVVAVYFAKKIVVVGNFSSRKQVIPSKFLVVRKEDDTFFLRAIK